MAPKNRKLLVTNCRLYCAADSNQTASVLIEDGIISRVGQIDSPVRCDNILDANGRTIAPGFIDVHIQGAGGADILDASLDALKTISRTCARFGTTSFLATTVFTPDEENQHLAIAARYTGSDLGGANLLGIHLEGPFISPQKRGMIRPECVQEPSLQLLEKIKDVTNGHLKMMTVAPELTGNIRIIRHLADCGIVASFGHSNATYEETLNGFDAGISHVTHLFNAMPSLHHRLPGPLLAIFETRSVTTQLICDGVHIHPSVLRFAFEVLGPQRIIPITDGMQATGLPDGKYFYNGIEYQAKDGAARYKDGTLIGTALGLSQLLQRLVTFTGCPQDTAVKTVTENPANLVGIEKRKGSIAPGKDADLVLLEHDCSVHTTIVGGKIVYQAN